MENHIPEEADPEHDYMIDASYELERVELVASSGVEVQILLSPHRNALPSMCTPTYGETVVNPSPPTEDQPSPFQQLQVATLVSK